MESFFTLLPWPWDEQERVVREDFPQVGIGVRERPRLGAGLCGGRDKALEQGHIQIPILARPCSCSLGELGWALSQPLPETEEGLLHHMTGAKC